MAALERAAADPTLWDNPDNARDLMRRLADRQRTVETWRAVERRLADAAELIELAADEDASAEKDGVDSVIADLARDMAALERELDGLEFELSFSGPYDARNAMLAIHAGAGGTESQDWAQMLLRTYLRWAERRGFTATVVDQAYGEEAGDQERYRRGRGPLRPTAGCVPSAACTGWSVSLPSISSTPATPLSHWWR